MEERYKKVSDSKTEQVYMVRARYLNSAGRLFGGSLMAWIDETGAITAKRHCNTSVTTVSVDNLHFVKAVLPNQIVVLVAKMSYVGNTSMEVQVDSFVEDLNGNRDMVNRAYLVYVALENGKPVRVPRLILETEEEKENWSLGEKREQFRRKRREEGF